MTETTAPDVTKTTVSAAPPAAYRKLIIEALQDQPDGLTIREIERRVRGQLPVGANDSVEDEVRALVNWEMVETSRSRGKKLTLTAAGQRFWNGIQAFR
ncbi:MAG: hypothetical protein ACYDAQ_12775 [Mycobacteriales bacterium]